MGHITTAEFSQKDIPGGYGWTKNKMDFSSNYPYDENGNIKTQNQWGAALVGTPPQIGQMVCDYDIVPGGWSNKVKRIADIAPSGAKGDWVILKTEQRGPVFSNILMILTGMCEKISIKK